MKLVWRALAVVTVLLHATGTDAQALGKPTPTTRDATTDTTTTWPHAPPLLDDHLFFP